MAFSFSPVSERLGLMRTNVAAAAALCLGVGAVPVAARCSASPWVLLAPLGLVAVGNGLSRPSYVTYLSKIACKQYVSQTMAIIDVTLNAAMVCGPQLTVVFERHGPEPAFLVAAAAAFCELLVAAGLVVADDRDDMQRASLLAAAGGDPRATARKRTRDREPPARDVDAFLADVARHLEAILRGRNYEIDSFRAQTCVREILDGAFPYLAPGGKESPNHMRDVGRLMASLGHDDWAKDVQEKFNFPSMRRRPKTFNHDIRGRADDPHARRFC